jgi:hypothetical protein
MTSILSERQGNPFKRCFNSMKILLPVLSILFAVTSHAQVRELWRTGLTNSYLLCTNITGYCGVPPVDYLTTTAAIDLEGSTFVGGIRYESYFHRSAFVTKFAADGRKLWDYLPPLESWSGVECMATDAKGNLLLSSRATAQEPRPIILTKLDPQGNELWRVAEYGSSAGVGGVPQSSVKVDSSGNVFLMGVTSTQTAPDTFMWSPVVDKFSPNGELLWRVKFPGDNYYIHAQFGFAKGLTLRTDGGVAVVGMQMTDDGFQGVVAKIDALGKLQWLRHSDRKHFDSGGFHNVMPGPFGTILAGGSDSAAVYSSKGRLIRGITPGFGCDVLGVLPNKSFLVNQIDGASIVAFGPNGRERWRMNTEMPYQFGLILRDNRAIAVGYYTRYVDKLYFSCFDLKGSSLWRAELSGYRPHPDSDKRMNSVLHAPDGTLRVVMNLGYRSGGLGVGVLVSSLSIESPRPWHLNPSIVLRARSGSLSTSF